MKMLSVIARILLGLIFVVLGLNGFLQFIPAPPIPGQAGIFLNVLMQSHYVFFVSGVQVAAGALLLVNRFVPLALTLLAGVIANILVFHATMQPSGLPPGILVAILWIFLAWRLRAYFAPLFVEKAAEKNEPTTLTN